MKSLALAAVVTAATGLGLSAQEAQIYKPGPGITNPVVVSEKKPSYTAAAMRAKVQGSVEMQAVIDTAGKPTAIKVVRGLEPSLDRNAVAALEAWRFKPAVKDGKAVPVLVTIEMTFRLRDGLTATPSERVVEIEGMGGAVAAQSQTIYKAGDPGVTNPVVRTETKPAYTKAAMDKKIQGSVELSTVVDTEGKPTDIKVIKSLDAEHGLDDSAVKALSAWRFKPATKDGNPVPVLVKVEITFTLRDRQVYDKTYVQVKPPVIVKEHRPTYTAEAMRKRVEGVIEVEGIVGVDGKVTDVRVVRGLEPGLDANAMDTMKRCTFTPGMLEGRAVPYRVSMQFTFTLRN